MPQKNTENAVPAVTCWSGSGSGGKTTVTLNTAAAHGRNGYDTLVIDLDPQAASITNRVGYGSLMESSDYNIAHTMFNIGDMAEKDFNDLIIPGADSGLDFDLIPAHEKLEDFGKLVATHWEGSPLIVLHWWMENSGLFDKYDTILIDVHGTKGPLVKSAITATQNVIIPMLVNGKGEDSAYSVQNYMDGIRDTFSRTGMEIPLNIFAVIPNQSKAWGEKQITSEDKQIKRLKEDGFPVAPFRLYQYNIHEDSERSNGTLFEYAEDPVSGKIPERHHKIFPKFDAISKMLATGEVADVELTPFDELDIINQNAVRDNYTTTDDAEEVSDDESGTVVA